MKLKKTKTMSKEVCELKKKIKYLQADIENIVNEHDANVFESDKAASNWVNSLPIETLHDSVAKDHSLPLSKPSLVDMKKKFQLRKDFLKKKEELEGVLNEFTVLQIDNLLSKIDKLK